jgi:CBS domain-containing protein
VDTLNTAPRAAFLARFEPFAGLAPEELERVLAATEERRYEAGDIALVEDAEPAAHLFVILEGAMELVHDAEVVEVIGPGDTFAEPSLLSGLAPVFTVRAREPSLCLLIPRTVALELYGRPAGVAQLARKLRHRLVQTGHTVHALPELGTIRVGDLVTRAPVFCGGGVTIRRAAETMTQEHQTAILVRDGQNLAILTDAVLREQVVAGGMSPENPVSRIVRPAVQVGPERIAVDAVVEMLDAGTDHIVVVDAQRQAVGVLSAADLAGLETRSPFALRHSILSAHDEDELVAAAAGLRGLFLALLDAGISPLDVGRVLSLQVDSVTTRLIELSLARRGPAPVPWAWLAFGSTARREFTLGSDVENGLAYDDGGGEDAEAYFAQLGADVAAGLVRCGFELDPNSVVAAAPLWRMSASRWVTTFRECLDSPDRSHLIRANVAFDFRQVGGSLDVTPPLVDALREVREHPDLVRRLARMATDFKPPLGRRGALAHEVDLKKGGAIPIANLARFFALSNGITISSTISRLDAVREAGALDTETAVGLREAFEVVTAVRLAHHAEQLAAGHEPDNLVAPEGLPPLTRAQLREALRTVQTAQKKLSVYVPLGL